MRATKEDIFLFKGITERVADLDDMRMLAESSSSIRSMLSIAPSQ